MTKNNIFNSVVGGIGNSDENTLTEYAKNIGKNAVGNFAGSKAGNGLFGRNLEHSLGRASASAIANFGLDSLEDMIRNK